MGGKGFLDWLIRSNLFIGLCAAMLAWSTFLNISGTLMPALLIGILFGTAAAYTLIREPEAVFKIKAWNSARTHVLIYSALSILGMYIIPLEKNILIAMAVAGLLLVFYSIGVWSKRSVFALRNWGILKLMTIGAVWTIVTLVIPYFVFTYESGVSHILYDKYYAVLKWPVIAQRFLFILMLTIPFDMKDSVREKALGHKSLPAVMGNAFALKLCKGLALLYWVASGFLGLPYLIAGSIVVLLFLVWLNKMEQYKSLEDFTLRFDGLMIIEAVLVIGITLLFT